MASSLANVFLLMVVCIGLVAFAWVTAYRFTHEDDYPQVLRWLLPWTLKGLALPLLLWGCMNFGISFELQPFMPQVQVAQAKGNWFSAFARYFGYGLFAISTYWVALTVTWIVFRTDKWRKLEGEARDHFRGLCLTSLIGMSLPAAAIVWLGGWMAGGLAAILMMIPIAGYAPGLFVERKVIPMYAKAIARMKFGKYAEAEAEVIRQLERCQDDFEGWLMLAELYAVHFKDLLEAEQTILEICDQPKVNAVQISIALNRLADWQLAYAGDPDAARRALQMICDRLPDTHLARVARLRSENLPRTAEEFQEQKVNKPVHLTALGDPLDDDTRESTATMSQSEAVARMNQLVKRLTVDPNDDVSREELARVLARQLGNADKAIEQVQLLLNMPDQPAQKRARWISLIAAWHLRYRNDVASARACMERLLREHPNTSLAFTARRRLTQMDLDAKVREAPAPRKFKIEV